jgi:1-aminocyclopropane-1-carboxylate deaminase/D-cysteine desulfhydrase-like pyridoxal-dependent ACC family enzyme
VALSGLQTQVHAVGVCDSPEEFYRHIEEVAEELGVDAPRLRDLKQWCRIYQGQGTGYARSTTEELSFLVEVAGRTGILLDPVYSGKALHHFVSRVVGADENGEVFLPGQTVLFVHTGGTFGLYDKESQLLPLLPPSRVTRLQARVPTR